MSTIPLILPFILEKRCFHQALKLFLFCNCVCKEREHYNKCITSFMKSSAPEYRDEKTEKVIDGAEKTYNITGLPNTLIIALKRVNRLDAKSENSLTQYRSHLTNWISRHFAN